MGSLTNHDYLIDSEKFYANVTTPNCPVMDHNVLCSVNWMLLGFIVPLLLASRPYADYKATARLQQIVSASGCLRLSTKYT